MSLTIKYKLNNKKELVFANNFEKAKYDNYIKELLPETSLEVYYSIISNSESKTLTQLAKVHVLIRELAKTTGYTEQEMKDIVKDNAQIYEFNSESERVLKSFTDCNKEELGRAIEACIHIGDDLDLNLR